MIVKGIVFAGTATSARPEMRRFVQEVLGMVPALVEGVEADLFDLPDGSSFAVASPQGMGDTQRSLGFLVDDVDEAVADLTSAGVTVDAQGRRTSANATCTSRRPMGRCTSSSNGGGSRTRCPPRPLPLGESGGAHRPGRSSRMVRYTGHCGSACWLGGGASRHGSW